MRLRLDVLRPAWLAWLLLALTTVWIARFGPVGPRLDDLGSVGALLGVRTKPGAWGWIAGLAVVVGLGFYRRRWAEPRPGTVLAMAVGLGACSLLVRGGHVLLLLAAAALTALALGVHAPERREDLPEPRVRDGWVALGLWGLVFGVGAVMSMHRHWAFGSGSWDLGCMVHNFYRSSHGLDNVSSVLGGVGYLSDHFMPGIYLLAPLFWIDSSAYMVLGVQAASLAVCAPSIYLMARHRGGSRLASTALAVAVGFSFGLQSAVYYDAHGITVGFGLLAAALWAIETRRLGWASVFLGFLVLFKESLGPYVIGLGLFLVFESIRERDKRRALVGGAWMVGGALGFVIVTRVLMPAFAAGGHPPEPHETFADFGATVFSALVGMLKDPLGTFAAFFVPHPKWDSLVVTLAGVGGLALLRPAIAVAALPLFAERFLSSKSTMWEMGYHYAAPLCLYAGWAAVRALPAVEAWGAEALLRVSGRRLRPQIAIAAYLLVSMWTVNQFGYRHRANFHTWHVSYFSSGDVREAKHAAVRFVQQTGAEVSVAAQNRMLPHIANRPGAWRLGDYSHAEVVLLAVGHNAWPYPDAFPRTLEARLRRSPDWVLVFSQGPARVFAKNAVAEAYGWSAIGAAP